jgi:hypothetical protein
MSRNQAPRASQPPMFSCKRPLRAVVMATLLTCGLALGLGARADEIEKCTVAVQGDSPVAKACQEGGVRLAKRKMKELVRAAREKGMMSECNDCHNGSDSWTLNKGAADKFRRLIELTK